MSSDQIDQACEREEKDRAVSLALRKPIGPEAVGVCLHCGEPVGDGRRWCDGDCRDDWQRIERAKGRAL
jgi:hypothetical protein